MTLRAAPAAELPSLLDEPRYLRNLQAYDGAAFAMVEGPQGDVLFAYGRTALFHLSADLTTLRHAVGADEDLAWQRVLLDTVLWTVSLLRGFELLHASAVTTEHGLIALVAAPAAASRAWRPSSWVGARRCSPMTSWRCRRPAVGSSRIRDRRS